MLNNFKIYILLLFFIPVKNFSQVSKPSSGKEYWMCFLESASHDVYQKTSGDTLEIYIYSPVSTQGYIEIPLKTWKKKFSVNADSIIRIQLPKGFAETTGSDTVLNAGVHIVSDSDISVWAVHRNTGLAAYTQLFPMELFDRYTEYFTQNFGSGNYFVNYKHGAVNGIVATEDHTMIEITPSCGTIGGKIKGKKYSVTLMRGEVYLLESDNCEFTGTNIKTTNCKPFMLFSGEKGTMAPDLFTGGHLQHAFMQVLPNALLGTEYYLLPQTLSANGYIYRVVATQAGTKVWFNSIQHNLKKGEYYDMVSYPDGMQYVHSNRPISVYQISQDNIVSPPGIGGTAMNQIIPFKGYIKKCKLKFRYFETPNSAFSMFSICIFTRTNSVNALTVNGINIKTAYWRKATHDPFYSYTTIPATGGWITIKSDSGFVSYSRAFNDYTTYNYTDGATFTFPVFDFKIKNDSSCAGDTVKFIAEKKVPATFMWTFGDKDTAYGDSVKHVFLKDSVHNVNMFVYHPNECIYDTVTKKIFIKKNIDYIFPKDTLMCNARPVSLDVHVAPGTDTSRMVFVWKKIPVIDSSLGFSHTFNVDSGTRFQVSALNTCRVADFIVSPLSPPQVNLPTDTSLCLYSNFDIHPITKFGDSSHYIYAWKLNNNNISTSKYITTFSKNQNDTFIYSVTVGDSGCTLKSGSDTMMITFKNPLSQIISGDTLLCIGQSGSITTMYKGGDSGGYASYWEQYDDVYFKWNYLSSGKKAGIKIYRDSKFRSILYDGCTGKNDTAFFNVKVRQPLNTKISGDTLICYGQGINMTAAASGGDSTHYTFEWFDDSWNSISTSSNLQISKLFISSDFNIILKDNCTEKPDTTSLYITVLPPLQVSISADTLCRNSAINFTAMASGGDSKKYIFHWKNDYTLDTITTKNIFKYKPLKTEKIEIKLSDNCSIDSPSAYIYISPIPDAEMILVHDSICPDDEEIFILPQNNDDKNVKYTLLFGDGNKYNSLASSTDTIVNYFYSNSGNYIATLIAENNLTGCASSFSWQTLVVVKPKPKANLSALPTVTTIMKPFVLFKNKTLNAIDFIFEPENGNAFYNFKDTLTYRYTDTGNFVASLIAKNVFQCYDTATINIRVNEVYTLFIPNAFSPNHDDKNLNEIFFPVCTGSRKWEMEIYNRWGEKICTSTSNPLSTNKGWDGTFKGEPCATGIYFYSLKMFDLDGFVHDEKRGTVLLIR